MQIKNLAATNDEMVLKLDKDTNGAVALQTDSGANAGARIVLEARCVFDGTQVGPAAQNWITPIKLFDPVTKTDVTELAGPSKAGWVDLPGFTEVRARRTDAGGNACWVALSGRQG